MSIQVTLSPQLNFLLFKLFIVFNSKNSYLYKNKDDTNINTNKFWCFHKGY